MKQCLPNDAYGRLVSELYEDGETVAYRFDNSGELAAVIDSATGTTTKYYYDMAGRLQLVRANDQAAGKTLTWRYDAAGNITHHREYAYTTDSLGDALDTVHYLYADSKGWGDLLTSFDGKTITYDTIGNPLNDGTWRYTWEHGRQLASMEYITEEEEDEVTWRMTYDANGLRTGRTNGTNTYTYWYDGSGQLVRMQYGTVVLRIAYSLDGRPISISYNGETYYYVLNQQGDVMAIVDNSGNWVVKYTYDPWGNILTTTASNNTMYNTLAQYNPLRYRGYVYDRETGLYYLQSRYYDPEMGRFLNADGFTSTGQGLLGNNMFAYCGNNPVIRSDCSGQFWGRDRYEVTYVNTYTKVHEGDRTLYYTIISYERTSQSLSSWLFPDQFADCNTTFAYYIRDDGVILYDNTQFSSRFLEKYEVRYVLAQEMYSAARRKASGAMSGRTVHGISTELLLHYKAYIGSGGNNKWLKLDFIADHAEESYIGSAFDKGNNGYDENGWVFQLLSYFSNWEV